MDTRYFFAYAYFSVIETTSFLYLTGFVRPLSVKRPVYNLVRAIYFAEA